MNDNLQTAYRYEGVSYAFYDPFGEQESGLATPDKVLHTCEIKYFTPKGFVINDILGRRRFINTTCIKQHANLPQGDALAAFVARTKKSIHIMQARIEAQRTKLTLVSKISRELIKSR